MYTKDKQLGSNISKQFDNKKVVSQMRKLEVTSGGGGQGRGRRGIVDGGEEAETTGSKIGLGIYLTRRRKQPIFCSN